MPTVVVILEQFLRTQRVRLNQFAPESAQKNINLEDLRPLSTPLPPLQEQKAIAAMLDSVDKAREKVCMETDMLQLLKESTADALLTGRVRNAGGNLIDEKVAGRLKFDAANSLKCRGVI